MMQTTSKYKKKNGVYLPGYHDEPLTRSPIVGKVSDIKVYKTFNPQTGKGKLEDIIPGGYNTISSGASFDLLSLSFAPNSESQMVNGAVRYTDANNYQFPGLADLVGNLNISANMLYAMPLYNLFGSLMAVNHGSAGLASHQSFVNGLTPAWLLEKITGNADILNSPWSITGSVSASNNGSVTGSGVPSFSTSVTVTSTNAAQSYTADSIVWAPIKSNPSAQGITNGRFVGALNAVPTWDTSAVTYASQSNAPTTFGNIAISAMFVLPYVVTVNANGALQFTYTFQGA